MAMVSADTASLATGAPRGSGKRFGWKSRDTGPGLLLAGPSLIVFTVFMFVPLVLTLVISFQRSSGIGPARFIGLKNYTDLLGDNVFWRSLFNTAVFTALTVPLSLAGGLAAALLLNKVMPARNLFRALFYVPVVLSAIAAGIIAAWMFNEDFGIINWLLGKVGVDPIAWQSQPWPALASLVIVSFWTSVGYNMVVYLAGLQGIDGQLYEAAKVDGTSWWQSLRFITVPGLRPTTFFLLVISIIGSFQIFDLIFVLTGGGPGNSTTMVVFYAYQEGFTQRRQGYAAAIGVVLYFFVLALTLIQWRIGKRQDAT